MRQRRREARSNASAVADRRISTLSACSCPSHRTGTRIGSTRSGALRTRRARPRRSAWAAEHDIGPAREDDARRIAFVVDCQNTFCTPGFELFVPARPTTTAGSASSSTATSARSRRSCPTLDTHRAMQVFHAAWLVDAGGGTRRRTRSSRPTTSSAASGGRPTRESRGTWSATFAAGGARPLPPDGLAVPRDAGRNRPRARLGGRGGGVLPLGRARTLRRRSRSRATTRASSTTRSSDPRSEGGATRN